MIDKDEADLMAHALGFEATEPMPSIQHRNYFAASPDGADTQIWDRLVTRELARLASGPREGFPYNYYAVTETGQRALRLFGAVDGLGAKLVAQDSYYIECADARGDSALFWRAERSGYTVTIEEAGVYLGFDAASIVNVASDRRDVAWPVAMINEAARRHVVRDYLDQRRSVPLASTKRKRRRG